MKIKEEHKDLKKKVNIAEEKRNTKRGTKSWHDLRTLKKLKLNMKDKLSKSKQGCGHLVLAAYDCLNQGIQGRYKLHLPQ